MHYNLAGTFLFVAVLSSCALVADAQAMESVGKNNENVCSLQAFLHERKLPVNWNCYFGADTKAAIEKFQSSNGLTADGMVGPATWDKLIVTVKQGDSGYGVRALQRQLRHHGLAVTADGSFGPLTAAGVAAVQGVLGLPATGVCDVPTWKGILAATSGAGGSSSSSSGSSSSGSSSSSSSSSNNNAATSTTSAGGQAAVATGAGGDKLTHAQAKALLDGAGISIRSSGQCSDKNNRRCTSLDGIRRASVDGTVSLKRQSGCSFMVTGGTETGHASGPKSHGAGFKVDISRETCITNWIKKNFKFARNRGSHPIYVDSAGNEYADEGTAGNHWDNTFG